MKSPWSARVDMSLGPRRRVSAAACVASLCLCPYPTTAHHSVLGFETTVGVTLRGEVTGFEWNNPHTRIAIDVSDGAARERWTVESESPAVLQRLGWARDSVRIGDRVTIIGAPARGGDRLVRCRSVAPAGRAPLPCYPMTTQ